MTELEPLARSLRAAAAATRNVVAADGFTLFLAPDGAQPHLSLAVPDAVPACGWAAALAALPAAFAAHGRTARIEAFAELVPDLLVAADAAGWRRAMTAPVMVLERTELVPAVPCPGSHRELEGVDRGALEAALRGAHVAFGGTADDAEALAWRDQAERGLRTGAVRIGVVEIDGEPRAGATLQLGGDAAELAGVWAHPEWRRLGLARQACHALLVAAFDDGVALAWLSAAEGALRLYQTLGFRRGGTQVNLEPPP